VDSRLSQLNSKYINEQNLEELEKILEAKVDRYQEIQEYLIASAQTLQFTELRIQTTGMQNTINTMHDTIL